MKDFRFLLLLVAPALLSGCIKYNGIPQNKGNKGQDQSGDQGGDDSGDHGDGDHGAGDHGGDDDSQPTEVTTYLVLSSIGLYNGNKGNDIEAKFLENAVEYTALSGSELPGKDVITSSTRTSVFVNWLCYEGTGAPTVYTTVPKVSGKILYANFSATEERPDIDTEDEDTYVYTLNTKVEDGNGNWNGDSACFYAYMYNSDSDNTSVALEKVSDSYYKFSVDKDHTYKSVVFVRMPAGSSFSWETKWNQTVDLDFDSAYTEAQITCWDAGEGKCGVRWVR